MRALLVIAMALQEGPDELIRAFDDPDLEARAAAEAALVRSGRAALPSLHRALERRQSAEARARTRQTLEDILQSIKSDFIRAQCPPGQSVCRALPVIAREIPKELTDCFPGCDFIIARYSCTVAHSLSCDGEWIAGLSRLSGELFTIRRVGSIWEDRWGEVGVLARYLKPVRSTGEALAACKAFGFRLAVFEIEKSEPGITATVRSAGLEHVLLRLKFDREGKLTDLEPPPEHGFGNLLLLPRVK